jgi:hypothetical protein
MWILWVGFINNKHLPQLQWLTKIGWYLTYGRCQWLRSKFYGSVLFVFSLQILASWSSLYLEHPARDSQKLLRCSPMTFSCQISPYIMFPLIPLAKAWNLSKLKINGMVMWYILQEVPACLINKCIRIKPWPGRGRQEQTLAETK